MQLDTEAACRCFRSFRKTGNSLQLCYKHTSAHSRALGPHQPPETPQWHAMPSWLECAFSRCPLGTPLPSVVSPLSSHSFSSDRVALDRNSHLLRRSEAWPLLTSSEADSQPLSYTRGTAQRDQSLSPRPHMTRGLVCWALLSNPVPRAAESGNRCSAWR